MPILKKEAYLPVVVGVTHSIERRAPPNPAQQMTIIVGFCR
ncbi:hypothetical protein OCA08_17830 [Bacillus cereus]|nr:hypothetical protein [Bacillus cereus]